MLCLSVVLWNADWRHLAAHRKVRAWQVGSLNPSGHAAKPNGVPATFPQIYPHAIQSCALGRGAPRRAKKRSADLEVSAHGPACRPVCRRMPAWRLALRSRKGKRYGVSLRCAMAILAMPDHVQDARATSPCRPQGRRYISHGPHGRDKQVGAVREPHAQGWNLSFNMLISHSASAWVPSPTNCFSSSGGPRWRKRPKS